MSFLGRIGRKKLVCFYCQQLFFVDSLPVGSVHSYPSGRIRQFTCPECCADNHLDENGEILDYVPDSPPKPAPIYARRRTSPRANIHSFSSTTRSSTPDSPTATVTSPTATTEERPFCRTCVNNQRVVTDAIAAYPLPPEDHPDYDEVVSVQFPKYRATLEERWPQVCARCAPRVNERIRTSNYQVKVASLGQMLARTSGYEAAKKGGEDKGGGKKKLETAAWVARGAVWCYFHVLMVVWHGAALVQPAVAMEMETEVASWGSCALRSLVAGEVDVHCYGVAAQQARWIPWSLLGFFWIYRERGLQSQPHKKLVGSKEYFRLEMGIYVFRMLCWYFVTPGAVVLTEEAFTMVHLGLFFLSFLSTLFSITILKLEDPPSISLREPQPVSGTPSPPESPPPHMMMSAVPRHPMSPTTPMRPGTANPPPSTGGSTFYSPVKRVRAASPTPLPRRNTPASPDAMDWNPTTAQETKWDVSSHRLPPPSFSLPQSSAQLQRQNQYATARSSSPSPFTGSLPPAPRAPAQRIVSALMQQPQRPTPPAQMSREQFFGHRLGGASAMPTGMEFEKVAAPGYRLGSPQYPPMAPQRFFVADEATGLESLMAGGFRLEDEPEVVAVVVEEGWAGVLVRVGVLVVGGVGMVYGGEVGVRCGLMGVLGAVAWRVGVAGMKGGVGMAEVGVVGVLVAMAMAGVGGGRVKKGAVGAVVVAVVMEVWGVLMRMQRGRARRFYEEERRRGIEEEKEARRRAGSAESARNGRGGFGGLNLG